MATNELKVLVTTPTKSKRAASGNVSSPIRVKLQTKSKLDALVKRANKGHSGRRVKPDDLICFALDLLSDDGLKEICNNTLTNKDRLELLFQQASKGNRSMSRDDFIGLLLEGKCQLPRP